MVTATSTSPRPPMLRQLREGGTEYWRHRAVWVALAVTFLAALVFAPAIVAPEHLPIIARQAAPLGLLAIGQAVLLLGRGFDLSVGGVVAFVTVLAAGPLAQEVGAGPIALLCLAVGLAVGVTNGLLVAYGRVSPLVATLGTGFIMTGAVLIYTGGAPSGQIPQAILALSRTRIAAIPLAVYIWLAAAVLIAVALRRTLAGRYIYAIGNNPDAAHLAGVPVARVRFGSHVLASLCAAAGGLLLAGFVGVGTLGAGQELMLNSIAAAVVGGTTLAGGKGGVVGSVGGALLLTLLTALMTAAGVGQTGTLITLGIVLLAAAALFRERFRT